MIEYKGKAFPSMRETARYYGIPYHAFLYRHKKWGLAKAIETEYVENGRGRPNSLLPPDIIELAEENGISYHLLYQRYTNGMHMFDAAIEPIGRKPGTKSSFTDEQIEKIKKNGLTTRLVSRRKRAGWTDYQAMNIPKGQKRK